MKNQKINFYLDMLEAPVSREKLQFNQDLSVLEGVMSGVRYPVIDNIPVLLPQSSETQHESSFRYAEHYEKDALVFDYQENFEDPVSRFEQKRLHEMIISRLPCDTNNILDIGCGNGWVAAHCLPKGISVVSADISVTNPAKAIQKYPSDLHYGLVSDALHLPVRENFFDAVVAAEIMEHVIDPGQFIQSLYKAIRPGGKIIITTPYFEKLEYSLCIHCNQATPRHAHLHSFHEKNVPAILPDDGLSQMTIFMNKYLLKLHTHVILQYFPMSFWQKIDALAEMLKPGALRFMIEIQKPE